MHTLLVADDEADIRSGLKAILEDEGYTCISAREGQEALELTLRHDVDLVVADLRMPGLDGHQLLAALRRSRPDLPLIMLTAFGSISAAVGAMKQGAADFLSKPIDADLLLLRIREILATVDTNRELARIRRTLPPADSATVVHGTSPAWQEVLQSIEAAAASPSVVLITGESGTGKEIVAREIHRRSERGKEPFLAVNCGAFPVDLAETELFGAVRGAYTGADRDREGLLRLARGGTLLLDEVGEMAPALQAKLLRAIEEKVVRPVGGDRSLPVRCRFLAATNRSLAEKIEAGAFRQDLYYRLAVLTISVPPLRERREDIPGLIAHLLHRRCLELRRPVPSVTPEALAALMGAELAGNVRELDNILQRALMICRSDRIGVEALPGNLAFGAPIQDRARSFGLRQAVRGFEAAFIRQVLCDVGGNRKLAAEALGISLATLYQRLQELGVR